MPPGVLSLTLLQKSYFLDVPSRSAVEQCLTYQTSLGFTHIQRVWATYFARDLVQLLAQPWAVAVLRWVAVVAAMWAQVEVVKLVVAPALVAAAVWLDRVAMAVMVVRVARQ